MRFSASIRVLCAGVCVASCAVTDEVPLPVDFYAMCTGTNDPAHRTPEARAATLAELGYAGTDILGLKGLRETRDALDRCGLTLSAVWFPLTIEQDVPTDVGKAATLLEGRSTLIWIALRSRGVACSSPEGDERAVALVRKIADIAAPKGLRVALYPHVNFWLERVEDAVRVAKKAGRSNVGVTFNQCHWMKVDGTQLEGRLREAMPYLCMVTINGADEGGRNWRTLIQTLDRGTCDTAALLRTLFGLGYSGPVALQGYGIKGSVRDNLGRSMNAWRAMLESAREKENHR